MNGVKGPGTWCIHVTPPKEWEIVKSGVAGVIAWCRGGACWCSDGWVAVGR